MCLIRLSGTFWSSSTGSEVANEMERPYRFDMRPMVGGDGQWPGLVTSRAVAMVVNDRRIARNSVKGPMVKAYGCNE
jgi:hypothetical protein